VLLAAVAAKTGKIDNKTIISALHSGTWPTPSGDLSWDASGSPQGQDLLVQWVDGTLQSVFPADKAQHAPLTVKPNWAG
jgi:branched-chain amino acid transport system substrate-binding protein